VLREEPEARENRHASEQMGSRTGPALSAMTVNATTINKACLSSLQAIYLADLMIRAGEAEIVVAGGMESMTNAALPFAQRTCGLSHWGSASR
jgi:acetyl-CoA acetyltransferase